MRGTPSARAGLTCVLQRSGGYGCNGPLPGAPEGANLVSGVMGGVPAFANTAGHGVRATGCGQADCRPDSRISYQTVSCGNDGATTTCVDSRSQSGFVVGPGGSSILNETPPLLYRPDGTNPFAN